NTEGLCVRELKPAAQSNSHLAVVCPLLTPDSPLRLPSNMKDTKLPPQLPPPSSTFSLPSRPHDSYFPDNWAAWQSRQPIGAQPCQSQSAHSRLDPGTRGCPIGRHLCSPMLKC
ncbi:Hypothetical predicted protein, partial [Pelobates cultripes]